MDDAYTMAFDALGLWLTVLEEREESIPNASAPQEIKLDDDQFIIVIKFDMDEYIRKTGSQAVKKTLSIPSWLNELAIAKEINFSSVLQKALKKELGVR